MSLFFVSSKQINRICNAPLPPVRSRNMSHSKATWPSWYPPHFTINSIQSSSGEDGLEESSEHYWTFTRWHLWIHRKNRTWYSWSISYHHSRGIQYSPLWLQRCIVVFLYLAWAFETCSREVILYWSLKDICILSILARAQRQSSSCQVSRPSVSVMELKKGIPKVVFSLPQLNTMDTWSQGTQGSDGNKRWAIM